MLHFALWKKILVIGIVILGAVYAAPNFIGRDAGHQLSSFIPGKTVNLGLDLKGGSYLLLKTDIDKVRIERLSDIAESFRASFRSDRIRFSGLKSDENSASFNLRNAEDKEKTSQFIRELGLDFEPLSNRLKLYVAGLIPMVLKSRLSSVRGVTEFLSSCPALMIRNG